MNKKFIFAAIAVALAVALILTVVIAPSEEPTEAYRITNLPGSEDFCPITGYQIEGLWKDPNNGYVPYLSLALSGIKKHETITAVLPCKYDKEGNLQSIWAIKQ